MELPYSAKLPDWIEFFRAGSRDLSSNSNSGYYKYDPLGMDKVSELYAAYVNWCQKNKITAITFDSFSNNLQSGKPLFMELLGEMGIETEYKKSTSTSMTFSGIPQKYREFVKNSGYVSRISNIRTRLKLPKISGNETTIHVEYPETKSFGEQSSPIHYRMKTIKSWVTDYLGE